MKEKLKNSDIVKISVTSSGPVIFFEILAVIFRSFYNKAASKVDYTSVLYSKNFKFILFYICAYLITIPLLLLIFHLIRGRKINHTLKEYLGKPERSFAWCAKWTVIGIGVFQTVGILLTYITEIVRSHFNLTSNYTMPEIKGNALGYVSLFLVTCVLAPFFEELLFRGTIFINNKPMGEGFAIITTGLFFALWHMNYSQFGIALGLGAVMCLMTLKTRSLFPSMICHFVNNLFSFIFEVAWMQFYSLTGTSTDIKGMISFLRTNNKLIFVMYVSAFLLILIFAVAGFVLLIRELIMLKKRSALKKGDFEIGSVKAKILYFCFPVTFITVVLLTYATFVL